jgi:Domain of unknown function (DUF5667)
MKTITGIIAGLVLLSLLCLSGIAAAQEDTSGTVLTDDIQPYNGPIAADSPLYGLKLALEDMDESFTANETERVDKQIDHARLRLSEVRRALELNESEPAQQALNNYWLKMNLTNVTISRWGSNATGLLHAQEQITKHQFVLEHLLETHPNNTGLMRAYNNSLDLEHKFEIKTEIHFNRSIEKDNKTILHAIRLGQKEQDHHGWPDTTTTPATTQTEDKLKGYEKDKGKGSGNGNPVTTVTTQAPSGTQQQGQGQGQGHQQGGNDDKGKGNSHGK